MKKLILFILLILAYTSLYSQEINWSFELKDSSFGQTAAGDIDGDGKLELVFGCYRNDGNIYALNSEDGSLLWKYFGGTQTTEGCNDTAPIIFDVDGDGQLEVIVPGSCNPKTFCLNGKDGSIKWIADSRGSDSPPTIEDIDNDGKNEILFGEFGGYVMCLNLLNGNKKWELAVDLNSWIQTAPTIVDLDGDGNLDFVVATWNSVEGDTNRVYAYRGFDRKLLWKYDISKYAYHGTAVADLDDDGKPEVILGDYSGKVFAINGENGTLQWDFMDEVPVYIGSPISVGDIDGDGKCELVFCDAYKIVAINRNGEFFWRYTIPNGQAFRGVALSDITGDGMLDVLFASSGGHAYGLKGIDGSLIFDYNFQEKTGKVLDFNNAPIIADFNKDDSLDMFIIGGKTDYPDFSKNYGYAFSLTVGKGKGPDWLMFQKNIRRTSSFCDNFVSIKEKENYQENSVFFPNPFSENIYFDLKNYEYGTEIEIYDLFGNLVKNLSYPESKAFIWDGTDSNGKSIPAGIYSVIIKNTNKRILQKIIKL